ncbi:MAG: (d)CMP kinase [Thermodesulfobacteriota bacterium]
MNDIITIDGPTGSGKSTVGRLLAQRLHYHYLDTGAMYRVVGLAVHRAGVDVHKKEEVTKICNDLDIQFIHEGDVTKIYMDNEDVTKIIREPDIDLIASNVSALDTVRKTMSTLQRNIAAQGPLVAEGRDMGTVVFPKAHHKFYIDASLEVRVERRFQELQKRGEPISREKVKENLIKRDEQDMNRYLSPLKPARDATIIDTTNVTPHQIVGKIIEVMKVKKK